MQAFSMQDWILTVFRARPVALQLEQEPEVAISPGTHPASLLCPHPRGSVTKVSIPYQGLNYHVVDEATIYSVSGWRDQGLRLGIIRPMVNHSHLF